MSARIWLAIFFFFCYISSYHSSFYLFIYFILFYFIFCYDIAFTWMHVIFVTLNSMFSASIGENMESQIL